MSRLISINTIFLVLALAWTNEVFAARTISAGEKPRTTEIAELVDAYNELSGEEDKDLKADMKTLIQKLMDEEKARGDAVQRVVSWSYSSSNITFWIAHGLLIFGISAATLELLHSWKLRSKGRKDSFEMEIGLEKIALRSSMYGSLILFASLAFYFMYLKFVYPVSYIP
jgi:hypothetical protein